MYNKEEIFAKIEDYQPEMWSFIEDIVNTDSGEDCPEGVEYIARKAGAVLEPLGFKITYHESNGPLQLIAERPNPGKPKVMIMGHMDTVFPKGTAAARPFHIEDGIAYGPGVMDMSSGIGIGIYTVKAMLESGYDGADITIYLTGDEENAHVLSDSRDVMMKLAEGKHAVFNMEPGREDESVTSGRKGVWRPLIKVKGIAAHAGNDYSKGASAILELAQKVTDIFAVTDLEAGTTCNVGVIKGGTVPNIMAEYAEAKLDIRFTKISELEKARKKIEEIVAKRYDERCVTTLEEIPSDMFPCFEETEEGLRLCEFVSKQSVELGFGKVGHLFVGGCSDSAFTAIAGVPTVCSMGPKSVGAHSANEYAYVDSYIRRSKILASCLMNMDEFIAQNK